MPPPIVAELALAVRQAGGRALLVGGGVRDGLLGRQPKDFDLEVYGLAVPALAKLLRKLGRVDEVGKSFGVLKVTPRGGEELDVSIPRRDSNAGPGHRGIAVEGDPGMSFAEACRRRDLTINAILKDPLTDELIDPYDGQSDLRAGLLRPVDSTTFLEDPLRALRAVQFAARLDFEPTDALVALCREASLDELPSERILGEWEKLLVKGVRPSRGLRLARKARILPRLFPGLQDVPELDDALDRLAAWPYLDRERGWRLAAGLAVWLDGTPDIERVLDVFGLVRRGTYAVRRELIRQREQRDAPWSSDADLRNLAARAEVLLCLGVQHALGADVEAALERAAVLDVLRKSPPRLLQGRDLATVDIAPGPAMGRLLADVYQAQLDGRVHTREQALELARDLA